MSALTIGVAGGAIQGLFDREYLWIGGCLLDETLHAGGERVIGMMHQDITFAQRREHALGCLPLTEGGMGGRHERPVLEVRTVERVDLEQRGQIEQARNLDHIGRIHVELTQQQFEHVLAHVVGHLEPDRRSEAASGKFAFEGLQQVLVAVLLYFEVGVPGDPEGMVLNDFHAGEQMVKIGRNEVLHGQEDRAAILLVAGFGRPGQ